MSTTPILYNTTSGFTFDNTKIQVSSSSASLVNNSGYPITNPDILEGFQMQASSLTGFLETAVYLGSDNVQYTVLVNGIDYYWSGATWAISNGTYAQSNIASVINTNCSHSSMTSLLGVGGYVQVRAFIHSSSGTTTPILSSVTLSYVFAAIRPSNPSQTTVWCYLEDILGNIRGSTENAKLSVMQKDAFTSGQFVIAPFSASTSFNSNGFASLILDETESSGYSVEFSISYQIGTTTSQINFIPCIIPDIGSVALTSITTFENRSATVSGISSVGSSPVSSENQITIINNGTNINIPTLQFSPTSYGVVEIGYTLRRKDNGGFYREIGRLFIGWNDQSNTWSISDDGDAGYAGPISGVTFSVTTGASPSFLPTISYTSDNMTGGGTYVGTMRYKIFNTFLKEQ